MRAQAGTANTGWETFLDAVIALDSPSAVLGRCEPNERVCRETLNALASSIVLVCRKREEDAPIATRREFITALKAELPVALAHLQRGNIAPVDLGAGRHRPRHGRLHPLRQSARRGRQAAVGARARWR